MTPPKYGLADLVAVQQTCIGARDEDPRDTKQWLEDQEIDTDDWSTFVLRVGSAGVAMAQISEAMGASQEAAFAAMFSAGFELGVRFQEAKQVVI